MRGAENEPLEAAAENVYVPIASGNVVIGGGCVFLP